MCVSSRLCVVLLMCPAVCTVLDVLLLTNSTSLTCLCLNEAKNIETVWIRVFPPPRGTTVISLDVDHVIPLALLVLVPLLSYFRITTSCLWLGCFALCLRVSIQSPASEEAAQIPNGNLASDIHVLA